MVESVSSQCQGCIKALKAIVSALCDLGRQKRRIHDKQVDNELERFSLWIGNIGAIHLPESPLSLESRLCDAEDILNHVLELLNNLYDVTQELLEIVSGEREGKMAFMPYDGGDEVNQNEEKELLEEIGACVTRLFRVSSIIRQAAPTDIFAKALSRNRYRFDDHYDIAHVGEMYPKLATAKLAWLQKRLGRAITQRRHYLSYVRDHREKLEGEFMSEEAPKFAALETRAPAGQLPLTELQLDSSSRPSTFFTKASTLAPDRTTPKILNAEEQSDLEDDVRSYTTISRSVAGDLDDSATARIPKLDELRTGSKQEVECPFCFRVIKFKRERVWRQHVFSDLRSYVCTFPNCDSPYFRDINEWFRHEMQSHRTSYTCQLCPDKSFQLTERYFAHLRKAHPNILVEGEEQSVLDIARKPLDQIERLASFAIPISSAEDDASSDAAIKERMSALSSNSGRSTLAFTSVRSSSSSLASRKQGKLSEKEDSGDFGSALQTASVRGHESVVQTLLDRGADVNAQGGEYGTALQAASYGSHEKIVQLLLDRGADVNTQGGEYGTALQAALNVGCEKVVQLLLDNGADVKADLDQDGLEHVVAIQEQTLPETHPSRLASQHALARVYQSYGRISEAVNMLKQVVSVQEKTLDETHPDRLASQHALAIAYESNGQIIEAVQILEHVQEKTLDETHPDRLASQHALAEAYESNGQIIEAVQILEHVVSVKKKTLDETHPSRLASQYALAEVYRSNGQIIEAVQILEHRALAGAYESNGQTSKAAKILEHVVAIQEQTLPETHPSRLASQHQLARVYMANGDNKRAAEMLEHVLAIRKQTLPETHPDRLASQHALARVYQSYGRISEAVNMLEQVVSVQEKTLGETHPSRLASQRALAGAYQSNGQISKAAKILEHVRQPS
ncbi:MAG: hypothetical protein Q9159_000405 [Coniocarpon cinnabarinum]